MTVRELLATTTSEELTGWQAFEQEYGPLGAERGDWQTALVAHMIYMANQTKKSRKMKLTDFVLRFSPSRREQQTPEEMVAVFKALAAGGGRGNDR